MIQSASYLVCLGKRERKKDIEKKRKKEKKSEKKREKEKEKKSVRKKKREEKKQNSDLSRLNLVVEFGLESVLCTV